MDEQSITDYILNMFAGVETAATLGYTFFFYGPDRMLPFTTIATADNEGDRVSNLDRPGVFRLNIGVSKQTFQALFGAGKVDVSTYDWLMSNKRAAWSQYGGAWQRGFGVLLAALPATQWR